MYTLAHYLYLPLVLLFSGFAMWVGFRKKAGPRRPVWGVLAIALICFACVLLGIFICHR